MKKLSLLFILVAVSFYPQTEVKKLMLMPKPEHVSLQSGKFYVTKEFTVGVRTTEGSRSYAAAARFLRRLSNRTGIFFTQDYLTPQNSPANAPCILKNDITGSVRLGMDESYRLTVSPAAIELYGVTDIGVLRGMETLLQLLQSDTDGFYFPACTITDAPRFPWRGLMLDVCRHFMPLDVVKRNIDAIAAVKMNVFHWHLSEDQGFRVECQSFPLLHQLASDGMYFTREQIKQVIAYADERGIRVVPEFDIPGHSTSWLTAYPELASLPGPYSIERRWGIFDPVFNPTIEATYKFFDTFFAEMCPLFPDEYMHIGGDENNGKQWSANKDIQNFIKKNELKDNHGLQAYFNRRILSILTKHGKKMMGWDEILHPDLPKDVMIHSWRGVKYLAESAKQGYMGILSNGYYIDLMFSAETHYLNDPLPDSLNLTHDQKKLIMGGETTQWAELVTYENVDSRIWPRTAAIAERLWSPASVKDVPDMYRRLERISFLLEEHGLTHKKNYDLMLRRLANNGSVSALKTLVDLLEPIKRYDRHRQQTYRSYSPYTRIVDAAMPESDEGRKFNTMVELFLTGKLDNAQKIDRKLDKWLSVQTDIDDLIKNAPAIREIAPQAALVSQLAKAGKAALAAKTSGKSMPPQEKAEAMKVIESAKKPTAETLIMIVKGIELLINAAP